MSSSGRRSSSSAAAAADACVCPRSDLLLETVFVTSHSVLAAYPSHFESSVVHFHAEKADGVLSLPWLSLADDSLRENSPSSCVSRAKGLVQPPGQDLDLRKGSFARELMIRCFSVDYSSNPKGLSSLKNRRKFTCFVMMYIIVSNEVSIDPTNREREDETSSLSC